MIQISDLFLWHFSQVTLKELFENDGILQIPRIVGPLESLLDPPADSSVTQRVTIIPQHL